MCLIKGNMVSSPVENGSTQTNMPDIGQSLSVVTPLFQVSGKNSADVEYEHSKAIAKSNHRAHSS